MNQRMLCAILAAIGLSVTAAAAEPLRLAQAAPAMLPAREISGIARSAGFTPLGPAMRRGQSYVLRATGQDGREMRVVIHARSGEIMSAVPIIEAMRDVPSSEPLAPPGYIPPRPAPDVYRAGPPIVYEGDSPMRRPLAPIPSAPPRAARAAVPDAPAAPPRDARAAAPDAADNRPLADPPPVIMREERGEHGLLPPPPERFPQRAAPTAVPNPAVKPAAKPAPVKRAAAPPLPKPKPAAQASNALPADDALPMPPPIPDKPDPRALPH